MSHPRFIHHSSAEEVTPDPEDMDYTPMTGIVYGVTSSLPPS